MARGIGRFVAVLRAWRPRAFNDRERSTTASVQHPSTFNCEKAAVERCGMAAFAIRDRFVHIAIGWGSSVYCEREILKSPDLEKGADRWICA
jgi:hypothetical protein